MTGEMKKQSSLFLFFFLVTSFLYAGKGFDFRYWEDSLISLRTITINAGTELERYQANEDFMNLLESVLNEPGSFDFAWDSVRNFSVLKAPDGKFKIFTWALERNDRVVENFGFIQVQNVSRGKYVVYPLTDKRSNIDYPQSFVGNQNNWYGAVYYKIIPLKTESRTYYTLLGFNGNNLFTNQKIIDILYFKSNGSPIFGAPVFKKYTSSKVSRIIFEYSKNATFSLKFERQSYDVSTGKRDPKTHRVVYEQKTADMIIFEQLIPMEDGLEGIATYQVPESSLNQGFVQENGKWQFLTSVKGRNPDKKMPKYILKNRNFQDR